MPIKKISNLEIGCLSDTKPTTTRKRPSREVKLPPSKTHITPGKKKEIPVKILSQDQILLVSFPIP